MMRQIKQVVAESNRNELVDKLRKGREERVRRGFPAGGNVPYGYKRKNKQLQVVEKEAHIIRITYRLANVGHKCQAIADYLKLSGF